MKKIVNGIEAELSAEEEAEFAARDATWAAGQPQRDALAARHASMDAAISGDQTITQLKAMNAADFDTWWAANVTNLAQANGILKRLARLAIRRLV